MTLTYSLKIWNEDADLPSGESSTCEDDSTVEDSFASALTTLDSACESAECASYHTAPLSSIHHKGGVNYGSHIFPRSNSRSRVDGYYRGADRVSPSRFSGPSLADPEPLSAPTRVKALMAIPLIELKALKDSSRNAGSEEEDSDGSQIFADVDESPSPGDGEDLPPPDEVVGNDTTEWHEDYSDNSNQAESLGFLDDSSDSQCDLSTMWDVPSFDQDSEWEGDPDADSGWDSLPSAQKSPLASTTASSKHSVPPQVMNMFKKPPTSSCDSTWHSHVDIAVSLRRNSSLSGKSNHGPLSEDFNRHGNNYRPWPPFSILSRSPFSTLDTIEESNSRTCSPLLAVRPRSRSHSSRRQSPLGASASKHRAFRCRSGSATGRLECSAHSFQAPLAHAHEAWSRAAWALDEDTRRVLARFQGFRPANQTPREGDEEGEREEVCRGGEAEEEIGVEREEVERSGTEEGLNEAAEQGKKVSWKSGIIDSSEEKSSRLGEQSVLVDESLLSSRDRARYRRHLRRVRLLSTRYQDYPSDSEEHSDIDEGSKVSLNV